MANLVESQLQPEDLTLSAATATNPGIAGFMSQYSANLLTPVHPAIVKAKLQQHISAIQLANKVRQQFAGRANRLDAAFQPPDISRTYILGLSGSSASVESVLSLLRTDPNVEYAEPDNVVSIRYTPNDPYFATSGTWGQTYPDLFGAFRRLVRRSRGIWRPVTALWWQ